MTDNSKLVEIDQIKTKQPIKAEAWVIKRNDGLYYTNDLWLKDLQYATFYANEQQAKDYIGWDGLLVLGDNCYPQKIEIVEVYK